MRFWQKHYFCDFDEKIILYDFWFEKLCNFVLLNLRNSFSKSNYCYFVIYHLESLLLIAWCVYPVGCLSMVLFQCLKFFYDLVLVSQKVVDKYKIVLFSRRSGALELFCWLLSRQICDSRMVLFGGCPYGCGDSFRLCLMFLIMPNFCLWFWWICLCFMAQQSIGKLFILVMVFLIFGLSGFWLGGCLAFVSDVYRVVVFC